MTELPGGPYEVDPSWPRQLYKQAALLLLLGLPIGAFMSGYGGYRCIDAFRVRGLANSGVRADSVSYDGNVSSRYGVFNNYDLDVEFYTNEDRRVRFETGFFSFGSGPDDGDPVYVMYDAGDPSNAILSWENDELIDGVIFWFFCMAMGLLMAGGLGWAAVKNVLDVRLVQRLAKGGRLEWARVTESKTRQSGQAILVTLQLRFDDGVTHKHQYNQVLNPVWVEQQNDANYVACLRGGEGVRTLDARGAPLMLG